MPQVESPTIKLYAAAGRAIAGDTHDAATHIALDKGSMAAFDETTNAPASEASEDGLTRAAATVTHEDGSVTDDTTKATHEFTCGATPTAIKGFLVMTATPAGNALMWCAFAADQNLENGDKLTCTGNMKFKKD
jgi:hypothetical protein